MTNSSEDQDSGPASVGGQPAESLPSGDHAGQERPDPDEPGGIGDEQLPEDLQASDDNPLAQPLAAGETAEVDLNEASGSYRRQQEGEDGEDGESSPGASGDS